MAQQPSDSDETLPLTPNPAPSKKETIGGFDIILKLGQGGMGAVFKARQPMLNRLVALKVMSPHLSTSQDFVSRFIREAASAANLSHPNMVQVHTAGEDAGRYFIAMEFVEGESLADRLKRKGAMSPAEAVATTIYVAEALHYAWKKAKLIHRDIKPDNIFLSSAGEVKVGDLGLAKSIEHDAPQMTTTGMMMGTPHYMSPEQVRAERSVDFRSDIYSLGCTLFHMLSGNYPYAGDSAMAVAMKQVEAPVPSITQSCPTCPHHLAKVVTRMMAKKPEARYQSYGELITELTQVYKELPKDEKSVLSHKREPKNHRAVIYSASIATVLLVVGLLIWQDSKKNKKSELAPQEVARQTPPATRLISDDRAPSAHTPTPPSPNNTYTNMVGAEMVYISPGSFLLGSTPEERAWAKQKERVKPEIFEHEGENPKKITISYGFWIGRTEMTIGQWRQFTQATGYITEAEKPNTAPALQDSDKTMTPSGSFNWKNPKLNFPPADNQAVTWISWNDSLAFCRWLTEREHIAGRLPSGLEIRLPSEAEWEYACRAGTQTKFWWGDLPEDGEGRLNLAGGGDGFAFIAPVDSYGARGRNGFGLADMLGNAREWCLDGFDPAGAHTELWTDTSGKHPLRGGCAMRGIPFSRCAFRESFPANFRACCTGFRILLGPVSAATKAPPKNRMSSLPMASPAETANATFAAREKLDSNYSAAGKLSCEEQIKQVMTQLQKLNPEFDGKEQHTIENGEVTELILSTVTLTDISPIAALNKLQTLKLQGGPLTSKTGNPDLFRTGTLVDLSPLKGLPLKQLYILGNPVRDLSPLEGMPLTELAMDHTDVTDLSPLKTMPLKTLKCLPKNTKVKDFSPLLEIKSLTNIGGQPVKKFLQQYGNTSANQSPPTPRNSKSNDPAPAPSKFSAEEQLQNVIAKLKELNPGFDGEEHHVLKNGIVVDLTISTKAVSNITPIGTLSGLRKLSLWGLRPGSSSSGGILSDLSPLKGLKLVDLKLPGNPVTDLSPLEGMPLELLGLDRTRVTDLSPLTRMPLVTLFAYIPTVTDFSPLLRIKTLKSVNGKPPEEFVKQIKQNPPARPAHNANQDIGQIQQLKTKIEKGIISKD